VLNLPVFQNGMIMLLQIEGQDLDKLIMIGDRVLIRPRIGSEKTQGGLFLPPGVEASRRVQSGYIIKCGPGYPLPVNPDTDEPWKEQSNKPAYLSLQAKEGDLAVFLQDGGIEIEFNKEKFIILQHSSILMLIRDESIFI